MKFLIAKAITKLIAKKVANRAKESATVAAAGGIAVTGVAAILSPEILDLIPEQYRGWVILLVALVVTVARTRREIVDAIREARNGSVQ